MPDATLPPTERGEEAHMLLDTTYSSGSGGAGGLLILYLALYAIYGLALYGVFKKAGKPGWAGFVPIYNLIVLLEVVGRPLWWIILYLIPIVNIVILIIVYNDLSKSFGKGVGFTLGLIFLSIIFLLILGFGSATYRGPAAAPGEMMTPPPPPPPGMPPA
jgi:hypothetical protein